MKIIGIMGPGADKATEVDLETAAYIGEMAATLGCAVLTGGMKGVMEAAAKGAKAAGGLTVGLGPTSDRADMNEHMDIRLVTGMGGGRNYMNILSSDVVVFVSVGSPGTLSELAYAIQLQKPSIVIQASQNLIAYINELEAPVVTFVDAPEAVKPLLQAHLENS